MLRGSQVDDPSGDLAETLLKSSGVEDIERKLIKDDKIMIHETISEAEEKGFHMVIFIGGTGVSPDDVTVEALKPLFDKELTGFNTLFTVYSSTEVGSRAISSRATAGIIKDILVFAIPGSVNAVETAMKKIILKEYEHLLYIAGILR